MATGNFIKWQYLLILLLVYPFSAFSQTWVSPTITNTNGFLDSGSGVYYDTIQDFCNYRANLARPDNTGVICDYFQETATRWAVTWGYTYEPSGSYSTSQNLYEGLYDKAECLDPNYQATVDSDSDGTTDQCHPTNCPTSDTMWSSYGSGFTSPTGRLCLNIPQADGGNMQCSYEGVTNPDGSTNDYTFRPTGSGCSCEDSEFIPCADLSEGTIQNFVEGDNGCYSVGDSLFCVANPENHCSNGVCDSGCGYINDKFACLIDNLDPKDTLSCQEGDTRTSCAGVPVGSCPAGAANCTDNLPPVDEAPCSLNDPRDSCIGKSEGEAPINLNAGIESKLDTANQNLKGIKDNTQAIKDILSQEATIDDINPATDTSFQDAKAQALAHQTTNEKSAGQTTYETDIGAKEGFFASQVAGLFPSGGACSPLSFVIPQGTYQIDACTELGMIKYILEWIVVVFGLLYVRQTIVNELKPSNK